MKSREREQQGPNSPSYLAVCSAGPVQRQERQGADWSLCVQEPVAPCLQEGAPTAQGCPLGAPAPGLGISPAPCSAVLPVAEDKECHHAPPQSAYTLPMVQKTKNITRHHHKVHKYCLSSRTKNVTMHRHKVHTHCLWRSRQRISPGTTTKYIKSPGTTTKYINIA